MSELIRETWRRYRQPQVVIDLNEYMRQIAPTPPALQAIREDAKRKGSNRLTMAQINREVAAVRSQHDKNKKKTAKQPNK